MDSALTEFLSPVGPTASATPLASRIFNIALAAATSTATDLTGANYTGLALCISKENVLTLTASVDIWYRWATATGTVDETTTAASTPANQGVLLPAGSKISERPPLGATWLLAKATPSAGTLCIQVASLSASAYIAGSFG
jgi:hypothetical protein